MTTKADKKKIARFVRSLKHLRAQGVPFIAVSELKPWADNPRLNAEAIPRVVASMLAFGWTNPILVRAKGGFLEAGHTRLAAALHIGRVYGIDVSELPCVRMEHSAKDARLYALADNRLAEIATWDPGALSSVMSEFEAPELELAGWDANALSAFDAVGDGLPGGSTAPDAAAARQTLAERFGVPPFSILDTRQGYWLERKRAWIALGIRSEVGRGENLLQRSEQELTAMNEGVSYAEAREIVAKRKQHKSGGFIFDPKLDADLKTGTSIFDPVLCELLYRWFSPPGGQVLDPFAGGSVRGIVAATLGRHYHGIELRGEQVEANRVQAKEILASGTPEPTWTTGDSSVVLTADPVVDHSIPAHVDFVMSCPPYADLERYSDDPADLSTMDYEDFRRVHAEIIGKAVARMRENSFAAWVIGEVRGGKHGFYRNFVRDTVGAFEAAGARHYNEMILVTAMGTLPIRAGRVFTAARKIGKTHQNVLVFCKGDPWKATERVGQVEAGVVLPQCEDDDD